MLPLEYSRNREPECELTGETCPRRERYASDKSHVAREGEDDAVNIDGWGVGSATDKAASDSPRAEKCGIRKLAFRLSLLHGRASPCPWDHAGRFNRRSQ
jgi:hypothetical protein